MTAPRGERSAKVLVSASAVLVNVFSMLNVGGFDQLAAKLGARTTSTVDFQRYILPLIAPGKGDLHYNYDYFDLEIIGLFVVIAVAGGWIWRGSMVKMLLRPVQLVALTLVPVTLEVYFFDLMEFYQHVTQIQMRFNFATWFSNADLLEVCLVFLALTASVELVARRRSAVTLYGGRVIAPR